MNTSAEIAVAPRLISRKLDIERIICEPEPTPVASTARSRLSRPSKYAERHSDRWRIVASDLPSRPRSGQRARLRISNRADRTRQLSKKIYVGNLPFSSTEEDLRDAFGRHGTVDSVSVITDRESGRPRGFAFVEMEEAAAAADAIRVLDGSDLGGRTIRVNEAQDRQGGGLRN